MGVPIRLDGRVYLDFEIDIESACSTIANECTQYYNIELAYPNDETSMKMRDALNTISSKYSDVFKINVIPVKGYFDSSTKSFYTTSDEVIKGLYNVFISLGIGINLNLLATNGEGIFHDVARCGYTIGNNCLYYGEDASNVFRSMQFIKEYFNELKNNNNSIGQK